jgi:DNA topoisomerase-3
MTRLFIAEKPSVARAIAAELGNSRSADGHIVCDTAIVTWCFGHMLEQAQPDDYLAQDAPTNGKGKKVWRIEDLPIIPVKWILRPKKETRKQLTVIGKLLKRSDVTQIVNAGDPDREGQLLVDEVIEHFKCKKEALRFWVSAQDSTSVRRGLNSLKPNGNFAGWSDAARARGNADWLIGMNFSRAYTLAAGRGGPRALLVVGRVQTPTLALVVKRDREIEQFVSKQYYNLEAKMRHANGEYTAHWKASYEHKAIDSEGRIIDKEFAVALVAKLSKKHGHISAYTREKKRQPAPIPFSLADLTMLASKAYGMTADEVLKGAQSLYEKHKLTSYPRTDTGHLPESQHSDAPQILNSIASNLPKLRTLIEGADTGVKSRAWDDRKVTAHHGIIPTNHRQPVTALSSSEAKLYELVVRRYLAQFYPAHAYMATRVETTVEAERFVTTGKTVTDVGWRAVLSGGYSDNEVELPSLAQGDAVVCASVSRKDAKTKPPNHYTEGTLIYGMENIHKMIVDPVQKKSLKDGDGIGTSATRASIITELKRRKYLRAKGKHIVSTDLGKNMVDVYHETITSPIITAINERALKEIEKSGSGYGQFMEKQETYIRKHVQHVNQSFIRVEGVTETATPKKKRRARSKPTSGSTQTCTTCGKALVRRPSKTKGQFWWGCSGFPDCRQTYRDDAGKPAFS